MPRLTWTRFKAVFGIGSDAAAAILAVILGTGFEVLVAVAWEFWDPPRSGTTDFLAASMIIGTPLVALFIWRRAAPGDASPSATSAAVLGSWLALSVLLVLFSFSGLTA